MSDLHRLSNEFNKHTPKGFDLASNNTKLLRDERGQSRYVDNTNIGVFIDFADPTLPPPSTVNGDVYILVGTGTVDTDWGFSAENDIVIFGADNLPVSITPNVGYFAYNLTEDKYYKFDGAWVEFVPVSENIGNTNLSIPSATNRTVTIPSDSLVDFGANARFRTDVFELQSVTRGFLMNRVTTIQMNGIVGMVDNELVFNTDLKAIFRYDATLLQWVALSSGYGIIAVYSGSGSGVPTFFATLQSALETCKASGGYFTVKLYSNITITSAIEIDYTGSGVGKSYLFRQLTIDFNGFSVTNAQANTSEGFDIRLSNNASVYQEVRMLNGAVLRTNGTGTHHALKINQTGRVGTIQMSKMLIYCENSLGCRLDLGVSVADGATKVCDFGGSTFISKTSNAFRCDNADTTIKNFNAIGSGSSTSCVIGGGNISEFYAENTSSGNAISLTSAILKRVSFFSAKSNSGNGLLSDAISIDSVLSNFEVTSTSGISLRIDQPLTINNFVAVTGNNLAVRIEGACDVNNGKGVNNSSNECIYLINVNSATNLEGKNNGSGYGFRAFNNTTLRGEIKACKGVSIGGMGGTISSTTVITKVDGCQFVSHWDNAGGHALRVTVATGGEILLSNSNFIVRNSGANVLNATSAVTVKSFSNAHNEVAITPINANVTLSTLASF